MKRLLLLLLTLLTTPALAQNWQSAPDQSIAFATQGRVGFIPWTLGCVVQYAPGTAVGTTAGTPTCAQLSQPNISGSNTVRQVSNRTMFPSIISGSNTRASARTWEMNYVPVSSLQVCIANAYVTSTNGVETTSGGPVTAHIVVEYPHGTFKELTWSGNSTGIVPALSSGCTDLTKLNFTIPAFAKYRINAFLDWSAGSGKVVYGSWSNICDRANGDEFTVGTSLTDNTMNDTVLGNNVSTAAAICWQPAVVAAPSNRNVWWIIGDSIAAGVNDMLGDPSGGRGILGRALATLGPQLNYGVPGDRAQWYAVSANSSIRTSLAIAAGANSAILQLGVNDFYANGRTVDNVLTDRATIRTNITALAPINVYDTTVTPETTSTDGWVTTANQTPSNVTSNQSRTAFNDFMRVGGTPTYSQTCTLNTSTSVTACSGLTTTTVGNGMVVNGTNIPSNDAISAVNQYAGTFTLASSATGSGATTVTFTWPTFTTTWPLANWSGLIDIARLVECATNQPTVLVANGGVWCPGYVGQTDGVHPTSFAHVQIQQLLTNQISVLQ